MKVNGKIERQVTIQQLENGYLVSCYELGCPYKPSVYLTFEGAVNRASEMLGLTDIGERVLISATKEPQEKSNKETL